MKLKLDDLKFERGEGRVYQHPKSQFLWMRYFYRGKLYRESTQETTPRQAARKLKDKLAEIRLDRAGKVDFVPNSQLRVENLLDALEADYKLREVKSLAAVQSHMKHLRGAFGGIRAQNLTDEAVDRYIRARLSKGMAKATVNRETQLLGQAFGLAIKRKKLRSAPNIRHLSEKGNARQGFFERGDFHAVIANIGDSDVADYLEWFFWTGMRPGEIRSLTWQAFDRETWTIRLHAKDDKTGRGRVIALEGPLQEIIKRRLTLRRFGCDVIFHRDGKPVGTFYKRWKRACVLSGITERTPYDLRRTAIRNMIRGGVTEGVAMRISGHRTRLVFDRYNIVSENDLREAVTKTVAYVESLPAEQGVVPISKQAASGMVQ